MTRLLRVEDIPLSDPELVHRTATFERMPDVFAESWYALSLLVDQAKSLGNADLVERLNAIRLNWINASAIHQLLRSNTATDQPNMWLAGEIFVCFVTFAETNRRYLMDEVERILTTAIYDFQPVPEIAALLPATYGAKYFS